MSKLLVVVSRCDLEEQVKVLKAVPNTISIQRAVDHVGF